MTFTQHGTTVLGRKKVNAKNAMLIVFGVAAFALLRRKSDAANDNAPARVYAMAA